MDHIDHDTPDGATGAVPTDRRPLGYWLRTVDALITHEFGTAFADEGVTRRDWMLLNAVSGDVDVPGLAERLARKGKRLASLEKRGWVDQSGDGTWSLTDEGRAAKKRIGAIVDGIRARVAGTVSPEDFATTMASLEAIAREFGWSEETAGHRERRGFGRGFGPQGRGFGYGRPGFGHGHPGFGPGFGRGFGPEFHPGFDPRSGHGCAHDHGDRHAEHHSGRGDHGGHHRGRGHFGDHRGRPHDAEHAYERGFDAGYTRGASERD